MSASRHEGGRGEERRDEDEMRDDAGTLLKRVDEMVRRGRIEKLEEHVEW